MPIVVEKLLEINDTLGWNELVLDAAVAGAIEARNADTLSVLTDVNEQAYDFARTHTLPTVEISPTAKDAVDDEVRTFLAQHCLPPSPLETLGNALVSGLSNIDQTIRDAVINHQRGW